MLHIAIRESEMIVLAMAERGLLTKEDMVAHVATAFLTGIEIGVRTCRAAPDRVEEIMTWVEKAIKIDDDDEPLEVREARFIREREYIGI